MSSPLYFTAVQLRIIQALYQCSNRIICVKLSMRLVLRNAQSFFVIFNRLMDIGGSHTNVEDLFDNITRKYHKPIQQLPPWSWKYSCGNGPNHSQKQNKKCFHPYKNHLKAKILCRVRSVRYVPRHTAGIYRRYDWYRTLRIVRYDISTFTEHVGTFGTT